MSAKQHVHVINSHFQTKDKSGDDLLIPKGKKAGQSQLDDYNINLKSTNKANKVQQIVNSSSEDGQSKDASPNEEMK